MNRSATIVGLPVINMPNATVQLVSNIVRKAVLDCIAGDENAKTSGNGDLTEHKARPNQEVLESEWPAAPELEPETLFRSPVAEAIKEEILRAGKKLWQREYVDGNGGNISARISDKYVICTPTLCSKGDMQSEDLSLVNLNNRQLCGDRAQTSEILLHLEIFKAVPSARAVIHSHPPYATAHAMAGIVPRGNLIPEQEVFIGPIALAPYETPGTMAFARTILPFVHDHNTILLTNHGVVCWADTVAHAEWYTEVVENYCKTLVIASQLGVPLKEIPANKIGGLMAMKRRLGLPDPRLPGEFVSPTNQRRHAKGTAAHQFTAPPEEIDELIASITSQMLAFLKATP
jgi:L-fuculose-phosphate aldolase